MRKLALVGLFLAFFSTPASAAFYSGTDLAFPYLADYKSYTGGEKDPKTGMNAVFFAAYVLGAADAGDGVGYSIPPDVKSGQVIAIVVKWMEEHPGEWNHSADTMVWSALREQFPKKP